MVRNQQQAVPGRRSSLEGRQRSRKRMSGAARAAADMDAGCRFGGPRNCSPDDAHAGVSSEVCNVESLNSRRSICLLNSGWDKLGSGSARK